MIHHLTIKISLPISLIVFLLVIPSCNTNKGIVISNKEIEKEYNESLEKWNQLKKEHNNSYEYVVSHSSFVGYRNSTKITVKNGVLVQREHSETRSLPAGGFSQEEFQVYIENEPEINSNELGFKAQTFENIYKDCGKHTLQVDENMNHVYFKTNSMGLLNTCSYSPKNCMDDCSTGVYISNFNWLE